ncbi:MAG TPA: serine--tRNA ligase, partial [Anaerolineaceae bacterium]|nr:serine--tRNA ligase [Anaerolineaceae bacterium]
MLDINLIREDPKIVEDALTKRNMDTSVVAELVQLDSQRRSFLQEVEVLKAERNRVSKEIGKSKDQTEREEKIAGMREVGDKIAALDEEIRQVETKLGDLISIVPNIPDPNTPLGKDESENVIVRSEGEIPEFDFEPKPHWDLGPEMGLINFDQGVKITGSRFYVLSGAGARLQRALIAFMLDLHIKQGYLEKYTPFMVKAET